MFRKLRVRFILIASVAVTGILFFLVGALNSVRFLQTTREIQAVLNILSDNQGEFPSVQATAQALDNDRISIDTEKEEIIILDSYDADKLPQEFTSHYFTHILCHNGTGQLRMNGATYPIKPDDIVILLPLADNKCSHNNWI